MSKLFYIKKDVGLIFFTTFSETGSTKFNLCDAFGV